MKCAQIHIYRNHNWSKWHKLFNRGLWLCIYFSLVHLCGFDLNGDVKRIISQDETTNVNFLEYITENKKSE